MDTRPDRYCCIGIDLGTSGCRGISIDHRGRIVAQAETSLPPSTSPYPAWREQQPEDWWQATVQVIRQLLAATRHCQTAAIAVDGTSSTLLLTDPAGQPLTAALMYNDQRAAAQCATLAGVAPSGAAVHSPSSSLAKLLWLLEQEAATHSRALHQSEWISGRLCGRFDLGDENNCLKLGYDPVNRCWPSWMEKLQLPDGILPNVIPPGAVMGSIDPASAALTGLPDTCQVIAGTTDSTAAALAAGLERPGDALTSLGSTLVCKLLSDAPLFDAGYGIYSHRIFGKWLTGGASNTGGTVLQQHFSEEELESLSRRIDPARSLCLDYYPLPGRGERFPVNDPDKLPRLTPVPKDRARFLQGLLEGITRIEKSAYQRLQELGAGYPKRVFSSGGGARNATWMAMRQRLLCRPVLPARHLQAAYGAAQIARRGPLHTKTGQ